MPQTLEGSCRCGAVRFTVESHTPQPYQRCYCSICRKTAGGGGYAINLGADATTLAIEDPDKAIRVFRAEIRDDESGRCEVSTGERNFCSQCATALWLFSPEWADLVHPFASAIDSELPVPPSKVHLMLQYKPGWVAVNQGPGDACFDLYPKESIEDWHKSRGLWVD
ncbi:GFA family protein [Phenylobacterium sp.]|uniref:GFA family protein n=1 Tax=Phenylobacterium sp. TaxID=1871053 RepID=UPI0011F7DBD3|nr:GFA family protein [Phenylobacterium sp.]THD67124.1 MAG: GFA family protein [Phenylobacterium sp.]